MAHAARKERIEMRVDPGIKQLTERASAVLGHASLTEYVTSLIRENAPKSLEREASIQLTNAQFDSYIAACTDSKITPSRKILEAAQRLDSEGY